MDSQDRGRPVDALMSTLPEMATRQEAADAAGVNVRTIDRWRASGLLTTHRRGGLPSRADVRVSRTELRALVSWEPERASA